MLFNEHSNINAIVEKSNNLILQNWSKQLSQIGLNNKQTVEQTKDGNLNDADLLKEKKQQIKEVIKKKAISHLPKNTSQLIEFDRYVLGITKRALLQLEYFDESKQAYKEYLKIIMSQVDSEFVRLTQLNPISDMPLDFIQFKKEVTSKINDLLNQYFIKNIAKNTKEIIKQADSFEKYNQIASRIKRRIINVAELSWNSQIDKPTLINKITIEVMEKVAQEYSKGGKV